MFMATYPYLDPRELVSTEFHDDVSESVLSAMASSRSISHLRELHIDIV